MRRVLTTVACTLALVLATAACGGTGGGSASGTSASGPAAGDAGGGAPDTTIEAGGSVAPAGFTAVTLIVTRPDGTTEEWCVWLADSQVERARGLMYVTDPGLGGKEGMAFSFPDDVQEAFWMRNTRLPLSIAYAAADGRIVSTTDMAPCPDDAATCPTYPAAGSYRLALEVPQGRLDDLGIDPSSRLGLGRAC